MNFKSKSLFLMALVLAPYFFSKGEIIVSAKKPIFVVHKHDARNLHYDFRLEIDGALRSWAIPKEPSVDPKIKRLAILTEDHAMSYANFEGEIPKGHYGAGSVEIWDEGTFSNLKRESLDECFKNGLIEVNLEGKKLKGAFALIKFEKAGKSEWIFKKVTNKN